MIVILSLVVIVIAATLLWARLQEERARRSYERLETGRKVAGGVALVLIAGTFLQSGRWYLILIALLAIAAASLYVAVERPHSEVGV